MRPPSSSAVAGRRPLRALLAALLALACSLPQLVAAVPRLVDAVEFHHARLDHYFVTANADEIAKLDSGFFEGWQRTGLSFKVYDAAEPVAGASNVCRFYGNPAFGLDSHFYSASPTECAEVREKFPEAWIFESPAVFQVELPHLAFGSCPSGTVPIYRAWNNRTDSNHRYTTDPAVQRAMIARGYVAEGYGPVDMPVAMCGPTPEANSTPVCTVSASDASPVANTTVMLSASCSASPDTYAWTGCTSSRATCVATSATAGAVVYRVVATNAFGQSAPAETTVVWRAPPPPPSCELFVTSNTDPPAIGSSVLISSACSNGATTFTWINCPSSASTCLASASAPGPQTYTLVARNAGGSSAAVSITVNWVSAPGPAPDFCGSFPSVLRSNPVWGNVTLYSTQYTTPPGFAGNGAWVIRLRVPADAPAARGGRVSLAEYNGPVVVRDMTISRSACDFRSVDPTGQNGPLYSATGNAVTAGFGVGPSSGGVAGLTPGQTYYVNIRNANHGAPTCAQARCDAIVGISLPR